MIFNMAEVVSRRSSKCLNCAVLFTDDGCPCSHSHLQQSQTISSQSMKGETTSQTPVGMVPVNWLLKNHNIVRAVSPANSVGIVPVHRLSRTLSSVIALSPPTSVGMEPVNALSWRPKYDSAVSPPNSVGMVPVNALGPRRNYRQFG